MKEKQRGKIDRNLYISYFSLSMIGMLVCDLIYDSTYIMEYIAFFCIVHFCATVYLNLRYTKKILTFYNIFITLVYLFHMGQVLLKVLFRNYEFLKLNLYLVQGKIDFVNGACFALRSIVFLTMGGMIHAYAYRNKGYEDNMAVGDNVLSKSKNTSKDNENKKEILSENAKKKVRNYVQMYPEFIIATTLPVHMILTFRKIIAMMKGTYFDTFEVGEPGIIAAYSNFFIIGIVLFMLKYRDSFKKVAYTYIATCAYFVMTMLTGSRGKGVIYIIFFTWLACKLLNVRKMKITKKHLIIVGVIVLFGLTFLSAVSTLRDSGQMDPIHMAKEMISRNNVVGSTLEEFGGTLYTVAAVKNDVPKYSDYGYGITYIQSLACILPDLGGKFSEINYNAVFLNHFQSDYLGGSVLGEMYYNFGEYGILVAAVLGFIMAAISRRIEYTMKNKKYMEFACYVMVFTNSLWWVRDCFNTMCRNVVWAIAYICVMNFVLKKYSTLKEKNIECKDKKC